MAHQARLSPWARHDPFQRHVGPNQRAKGWRERARDFSLKYVDPRATLGLSSLHPAGRPGRILAPPCRQSVYRMIQKHHIIFISVHRASGCLCSTLCRSVSFLAFLRGRRQGRLGACDHHYACLPTPSRPPPHRPPQPPTIFRSLCLPACTRHHVSFFFRRPRWITHSSSHSRNASRENND